MFKKVSEGGTGSRHPLLGDVGRSPYLNFLEQKRVSEMALFKYKTTLDWSNSSLAIFYVNLQFLKIYAIMLTERRRNVTILLLKYYK